MPGGNGLLVCQYAVPAQRATKTQKATRLHTRERRVADTSRIVEVNGMQGILTGARSPRLSEARRGWYMTYSGGAAGELVRMVQQVCERRGATRLPHQKREQILRRARLTEQLALRIVAGVPAQEIQVPQ